MALYVNGSETDDVYVGGEKIDRVFANGTLVYESTIYIAKPTVAGAYTYNGKAQSAVISGYDSAAMVMSGTKSATNAGTYHVYFTLNKGYAWKDGTTDKLDITWTIGKLSVAIPSLSTTSFAWIEGDSHSVTVKNLNTTHVAQSGETSVVDSVDTAGKHTVTWTLKNTTSTQWTDGTTAAKSATWLTAFATGTSHWKNDIYNQGWNSGYLAASGTEVDWGGANQPYIHASAVRNLAACVYVTDKSLTANGLHASVVLEDAESDTNYFFQLALLSSVGSSGGAYAEDSSIAYVSDTETSAVLYGKTGKSSSYSPSTCYGAVMAPRIKYTTSSGSSGTKAANLPWRVIRIWHD